MALAGLVLALMLALTPPLARAAEMEGFTLPPVMRVGGTELRLNGMGLRTYSILGIHIYVAGLYLEQPSRDGEAVLRSPQKKLMVVHFVHDVDASDARKAWRDGLVDNCIAPCRLPAAEMERFLAAVTPLHSGDNSTLLFSPNGVEITLNGRPMGSITDSQFGTLMLATFIGPKPPTPQLKRGLLGEP